MGKIIRENKKRNIILFLVSFIVLFATVGPILHFTDASMIQSNNVVLDSNWNVEINNEAYEDVELSTFTFGMLSKGDELTLTTIIPEGIQVDNAVLKVYSIYSTMEVWLDKQVIYTYGIDRNAEGKLIGYGTHYVTLPEHFQGEKLTIHMKVTENEAFSGIPALEILDCKTMLSKSISNDRIRLSVSMFLIVFGFIAMLITSFMLIRSARYGQLYAIAMFSFLIGCWTLCNNDMINYFTQNLLVKVYMEYLCIYLLPIPFLFYFLPNVREKHCSKLIRGTYGALLLAQSTLFVCALVLQLLNIVHLPVFLTLSHVLMGLDLIFIIEIAVNSIVKRKKFNTGIQWGMAIVVVFILIELVRYNLDKYLLNFDNNRYDSTLCIGALMVVIALIMDFMSNVGRSVYKAGQQELLESLAYTDELTGAANRRKCEDEVAELETAHANYAVISFDLNLLKHMNDTYGHEVGDEAIKRFAKVLKKSFPEPMIVGRVGGDEFMVVVPDVEKLVISGQMELYDHNMKKENEKMDKVILSAAYGYAYRNEFTGGDVVHSLFRRADERMYECKRNMKQKMGLGLDNR